MHIPIPTNAKRVFKGVLYNIYQRQQDMFDGSKANYELAERQASVDVVGVVGDKIIVIWQEQPRRPLYPALPGGRVEVGETAVATARREFLEETGFSSSDIKLMDEYFGHSQFYFHEHIFVARGCQKAAEPKLDSGERIEIRLVSFDEFLTLCRHENFAAPVPFRFKMYEALLDEKKKEELKRKIFG